MPRRFNVAPLTTLASTHIVRQLYSLEVKYVSQVQDICHYFGPISTDLAHHFHDAFAFFTPDRRRSPCLPLDVIKLALIAKYYDYATASFPLHRRYFEAIEAMSVESRQYFFGGVKAVEILLAGSFPLIRDMAAIFKTSFTGMKKLQFDLCRNGVVGLKDADKLFLPLQSLTFAKLSNFDFKWCSMFCKAQQYNSDLTVLELRCAKGIDNSFGFVRHFLRDLRVLIVKGTLCVFTPHHLFVPPIHPNLEEIRLDIFLSDSNKVAINSYSSIFPNLKRLHLGQCFAWDFDWVGADLAPLITAAKYCCSSADKKKVEKGVRNASLFVNASEFTFHCSHFHMAHIEDLSIIPTEMANLSHLRLTMKFFSLDLMPFLFKAFPALCFLQIQVALIQLDAVLCDNFISSFEKVGVTSFQLNIGDGHISLTMCKS